MSQSRVRRAAKAKQRRKARARAAHDHGTRQDFWGPGGFDVTEAELAEFWWMRSAVEHEARGLDSESFRTVLSLPRRVAGEAAETFVLDQLDLLWAHGWQPAEVHRQGRLGTTTVVAARLAAQVVAADHARRRASTLDPAWRRQVEQLGLSEESGRTGWLGRWAEREGLPAADAFARMLEVLVALRGLPPLEPLMPMPGPPGGRPRPLERATRPRHGADPVLERVRNLLAKAESTTFEAEATALTAKAQELITRHAIDLALVQQEAASGAGLAEIRVPVDAPYADAKSLLLQTVAEAGRCRAVFMPRVQMSTVLGFPEDLEAVDMLFTSLLVQAQHALNADARDAPAGGRARRASYRSAFLLSFTQRIADRLREVNQAVFEQAEQDHGTRFLPVLADRTAVLDDFARERFGDLDESAVRGGFDQAGWVRGRMAADAAQLTFGELSGDPALR
jgi:hypothetical protein